LRSGIRGAVLTKKRFARGSLGIDLEEEFLRKMDIIDKRMAMTKKLKLQKT